MQTFRTRLYVLLHDCMISLLQRIELARDFRQKEDSSFCECNSYAISKNEWRWWNIIDMDRVGIRSLDGAPWWGLCTIFLKTFEIAICYQRFCFLGKPSNLGWETYRRVKIWKNVLEQTEIENVELQRPRAFQFKATMYTSVGRFSTQNPWFWIWK